MGKAREEKPYCFANFLATLAPVPGPTPAITQRGELVDAILVGEGVVKCRARCLRRLVGGTAAEWDLVSRMRVGREAGGICI